ncbi:MAG: adenosylcobalamin-dependent ribonucleoside-diphosphate reductase [Planctomycetota bacterium]|jgi:ribonucleoside-diphosphate reductase alpha chain
MAEFNIIPAVGEAPSLSVNALTVLQSRYLIKDQQGECIETPAQLFSRVALLTAQAEAKYGANSSQVRQWHRKFYDLMASLKFLPNSPALMNANRPGGMLSACFVLPIEDSIEAIFETIKQTALIQKAGGGTGFSFDKLRPTGDLVASSGGTTSGPMSFWRVFSEATNAIQQGAFRRGANMGMMSVNHPDILKFLYAKQNLTAFTNFNVSVKITDGWMKTLFKSGQSLQVVENPRTQERYLLPKPLDIASYTINDLHRLTDKKTPTTERAGQFYTVGDIWKMVVNCAHKTGEPGIAFIDRINRDNPTPSLGQIEATNPCGEQPLLAFEACTLGSINLVKFVKSQKPSKEHSDKPAALTDGKAGMDWPGLAQTVKSAVRFLDNILDVCNYPVRDTVRLTQANRKIGLGVMGFADCLFLLGIAYDSQEAMDFGETVMKFINKNAHDASSELADLRGPFPNWNQSTWRTEKGKKVRNASITCIAPTGTISIIADCSCGIEPVYSPVFVRQVLNGSKLLQINPVFKQAGEKAGFYNKKLENQIAQAGSIQKIRNIPHEIRKIFKFAYDIKPECHIQMQAGFQKHCDAAVSKTINLVENATVAAVDKAYKSAYKLGCKGITIYRKGSREQEPMSLY